MTPTDIAAARQWIARLRGELAELGMDDNLRDASRRRVVEGIDEEIARVERLIDSAVTTHGLELVS